MRHYLSISISSFIHLFIFIHSSALFNIYTRLLIPSLSPLISLFPHCCSFSLSSYPHYFVTPHCSQLTVHQITSLNKQTKKKKNSKGENPLHSLWSNIALIQYLLWSNIDSDPISALIQYWLWSNIGFDPILALIQYCLWSNFASFYLLESYYFYVGM